MGVPVTVAMLFENNVSRLYDLFCAVLRCAAHKHDKEIGMSLTQKQKTKTKRKKRKNNNEYNKKKTRIGHRPREETSLALLPDSCLLTKPYVYLSVFMYMAV